MPHVAAVQAQGTLELRREKPCLLCILDLYFDIGTGAGRFCGDLWDPDWRDLRPYFREKGTVAVGVFGDAEVDGAGVAWRGQ